MITKLYIGPSPHCEKIMVHGTSFYFSYTKLVAFDKKSNVLGGISSLYILQGTHSPATKKNIKRIIHHARALTLLRAGSVPFKEGLRLTLIDIALTILGKDNESEDKTENPIYKEFLFNEFFSNILNIDIPKET